MSEELKPAAVHDANVFLPGSLGPVRREVVLAYEHDRVVDQLRAELSAIKAGQGEAVYQVRAKGFESAWSDCEKAQYETFSGYASLEVRVLYTSPPSDPGTVPVHGEQQELEWLEGWLRFAAEPIGQECCGRGMNGECCGCPDPVYPDIEHIGSAMNTRREELRALLAQSEWVKP